MISELVDLSCEGHWYRLHNRTGRGGRNGPPAKTGATVVICILNTADLKRIHSAMKTLRCNSHGFVLWVTSKEKIHEGAQ